ncbi:hypothetical protein LguiB_015864 [Lonicera macranthoides]
MERLTTTTLIPDTFMGARDDITQQLMLVWEQIKAPLIVPILKVAMVLCLAMSLMLFIERIYMSVAIVLVKIFSGEPHQRYKFEPIKEDVELGSLAFPAVLVQIPMFNEREDLVEYECKKWANKGINIRYQVRENREGYKAGALKDGLMHDYVKHCEYVVIFDADFQPDPDFLHRSIPFLVHNPQLALVQARWKFGTAGVWRIAAINEAGGWNHRTTVEDMDLAVRAGLKGWKFLYLGSLHVKSELPGTFKAFRYQQHRWSCGPANLFRKMAMEIIRNKRVTLWKKVYVIYSFFFVRKIVGHIVTFFLYCVVMPATVLVPEVEIPRWGAVYIPVIITLLNAAGTPRSIHLLVFWILFENVMSLHRTRATFIGLLEGGRANEWVVTEKLGDALKNKPGQAAPKRPRFRIGQRLHLFELFMGAYLFFCGIYDLAFGKNHFFVYLFMQAISFFVIGFGYVGTIVPS